MAVGRELVTCTLGVVSIQGVRWGEGGTVRGGDFILCYGKASQPAVTVFCSSEVLTFYCSWFCSTDVVVTCVGLTFRHRSASCILGQAFRYSPENAFYIFNQQIYLII